jgi:beta-glucosidase
MGKMPRRSAQWGRRRGLEGAFLMRRAAPSRHLAVALVILGAALAAALGGGRTTAAHADACPWVGSSASPDARAHQVVAAMTLDEKLSMVRQPDPVWTHYGVAGYIPPIPRLCVPDLYLNDAGAGVGDQEENVIAFPAPIAQAATWDTALQRDFGRALGWEAWHKGVNVQLAPNVNIARVPMNGRNSEAFGEDPFLAGQTGVAEIKGIQDNNVIATVKHYALNNHEQNRMTVSSDADERTIHEIYLPAFEAAVKQGDVGSVMCSYNRINGTYACENDHMLNGILKGELGFSGFVMSDWRATHSTVQSANAGMDMEMDVSPGTYYGDPLKTAVQSGQVPMSRMDDMVIRILRPMFQRGIFEHPHAPEPQAFAADVRRPEDLTLARKISEDGTVLLKNSGNVLPIAGSGKRIAVIGPAGGPVGTAQSYGTGGSSHIPEFGTKADLVTPFQGIQQRGQAENDVVTYTDGTSTADAVAAASAADVVVVFGNDEQSESNDRPDLSLSSAKYCTLAGCAPLPGNQDAMIDAVAQANPNTVVVLDTGGPMVMPWLDKVKGVMQAWYPGQEDGNAIAALLFGDVNPSAKLPQTFPKSVADLPTKTNAQFPGTNDAQGVPHAQYSEGLKVGYRWYDSQNIQPLFPFGYGLSYTTFALRKLQVKPSGSGVRVSVNVTNTGSRDGAEVPQVYVAMPASTGEPPKRLAGFEKVSLKPGQTKTATVTLGRRAFSYWDTLTGAWVASPGCYGVLAGNSSRDLPLSGKVAIGNANCAGALARIGAGGKCVDRRKFTFTLHHGPNARVVRVKVYVNGKRKLSRKGNNIRKLTLRRLPQGTFKVRIVATQSSGSKLISTRTYRGCKKSKPKTRANHGR